jgi:hypothetical protein
MFNAYLFLYLLVLYRYFNIDFEDMSMVTGPRIEDACSYVEST